MNCNLCLSFLCVLLAAFNSRGQTPEFKKAPPAAGAPHAGPQPSATELIERNFFEPELIMRNQNAIALSGEQQKAIREEVVKAMPRLTELNWQQSAETEAMVALFNQERPEEKQVQAQLEKLLEIENEIKRVHAGLLVRIRNQLTPEQQTRLRAIKGKGAPNPKLLNKF